MFEQAAKVLDDVSRISFSLIIIKSLRKNKLTTEAARFIDSRFDDVTVRFPSDAGGVFAVKSLFEVFVGVDNEPDRLLNTLKIFDSVRFLTGAGDTRPEVSGR